MNKDDRTRFDEVDKMIAQSRELRERSRSLVKVCREQIARTNLSQRSIGAEAAAETSTVEFPESTAASK